MTELTPNRPRWPTVIGVLGVLAAALSLGWSQPSPGYPLGSDWGHHFTVAEFIWHPDPSIGYPLFRRPWYGWLMGALGEGMGYLEAAQFIGWMSAVVMVLAAGLGAWALAGPLAAPVAALIAAWMPLIREGGLWVNHYPLLGATCGVAIAAGAAAGRWPRWPWVILAGLSAGAAAAIDVRGEAVVPAVGLLVAMGLPWRARWGRTALLLAGLLVSAAAVPAHWAWLDAAFQIPALEFEAQVEVQRRGVLGQIHGGIFQSPRLEAACAGVVAGPMDLAGLRSPCATALRHNALGRFAEAGVLPRADWLWLALLVLIPAGRTWRQRVQSSVASAVVFGLPLAALWVGMGWVTYFPRYILAFGAVFAMALPVAIFRVVRVAELTPKWLATVGAVIAAALAVSGWPGTPQALPAASTEGAGADRAAGHFARWARSSLGTDDYLVDCAGLAVDSLLLPLRPPYIRFPPGDPACASHISSPAARSGETYLITMHQDLPQHMVALAHSRTAISGYGWTPIDTGGPEGYQLWVLGDAR